MLAVKARKARQYGSMRSYEGVWLVVLNTQAVHNFAHLPPDGTQTHSAVRLSRQQTQ